MKPLLFVVKASQQKRKTFKNEENRMFFYVKKNLKKIVVKSNISQKKAKNTNTPFFRYKLWHKNSKNLIIIKDY